jgi:UDP-N-acetylmuramyl pentapeptide phosphotransferase/UDP-N-acetylglucosamine-1-phosphate transferase
VRSRPNGRSVAALPSGALLGAAATSWAVLRLGRGVPVLREPWARTNHAGDPVTLLEGPAWVTGAVAGVVLGAVAGAAAGATGSHLDGGPRRASLRSAVVVAIAAGALGVVDDLAGGTSDKGLKGHLGALARGEVTTGAVKVVGLAATGLVGAALSDAGRPFRPGLVATLVGGAVVAGAANAVNLFDLRPGRALKVTVAAALPFVGGVSGAAAVGASLGVVRDDLRATAMLGDTGANAAGALVGLALVERTGTVGRVGALVVLAALTIASERVSFTRVIEGRPLLRRLDEWGRDLG